MTLGMVLGLASRQAEGFLRSLCGLLQFDNEVPDFATVSKRKAKLGKVALDNRNPNKSVHISIDSSGTESGGADPMQNLERDDRPRNT